MIKQHKPGPGWEEKNVLQDFVSSASQRQIAEGTSREMKRQREELSLPDLSSKSSESHQSGEGE